MKPKLAFIDHSFHQKTKSTVFLMEILKESFEVITLWDDRCQGGKGINLSDINKHNCEYVLFFQTLPSVSDLKLVKQKIIWVPMYDYVVTFKDFFWKELSTLPIKIISFSSTLSKKMESFGLDCLTVQYFMDPKDFETVNDYEGLKIFFWQRTDITFDMIKKIIGNQKVDKFILKIDADPGFKRCVPTKSYIAKYNIKIVEWFDSKEDYYNALRSCNLFIAPRKYEGIGMSFLEAMSNGLSVLALDNPTMNEYITNKETGYLFSANNLYEINFSDLEQVALSSREYCIAGYKKWLEQKVGIGNYVQSKYKKPTVLSKSEMRLLKKEKLLVSIRSKIGNLAKKFKFTK